MRFWATIVSAALALGIWANDNDGFSQSDLQDWWNSLWNGSLQWMSPWAHWHHEPFVVAFFVLAAVFALLPRRASFPAARRR